MVDGTLDTTVIVDALRRYPPALAWLQTQSNLGVARIVWLEVLNGVQNKVDRQRAINLLSTFDRIELTSVDFDWAIEQCARYKLSHNVCGIDCLIAAVCHRLQLPLYTMNLKHFSPILGKLAQKPY
jgi:predicted nucleic acid-binding protein